MPFKEKLMKEPKFEKIAKILIPARFWPVWPKLGPSKFFSSVLPLLDVKRCRKLSSYSISRKTHDRNSRKWRKTSFWAWFRTRFRYVWPNFGPPKLFSWVVTQLDVRYYHKLSLYAISRKTYNSNSTKWRKTSFRTWFRLGPNSDRQNVFQKSDFVSH